ncbi:MAG: GtrA family protein [Myxococcota bacterium]|nr:GtrA family protein [Myxococcota bacterium]
MDRLRKALPWDRLQRFLRFAVVGASGVFVNQGLLMLLHGHFGWPLLAASVVAIETAILNNFFWSSVWIWRYDYERSFRRLLAKLLQYQVATLFTSMVVNSGVLAALVYGFSIDYRIANLAGIAAGMGANFAAGELWIFRGSRARSRES